MADALGDEGLLASRSPTRARAAEYDVTAYGDVAAAATRIERIVDVSVRSARCWRSPAAPGCGRLLWRRRADSLLAVDSRAGGDRIAQSEDGCRSVRFEVVDVFTWKTDQRFDTGSSLPGSRIFRRASR